MRQWRKNNLFPVLGEWAKTGQKKWGLLARPNKQIQLIAALTVTAT
jgi:hypothetical protein